MSCFFFQTADETFSNIQTVVSLGREEEFFQRYKEELVIPYKYAQRIVIIFDAILRVILTETKQSRYRAHLPIPLIFYINVPERVIISSGLVKMGRALVGLRVRINL
jgi:hypothetical protein